MGNDNPKIEVYGSEQCSYCNNVKKFLDLKKIPYQYIDVEKDGFDMINLVTIIAPGARTIPIVMIDGEWIGGFNETVMKFS